MRDDDAADFVKRAEVAIRSHRDSERAQAFALIAIAKILLERQQVLVQHDVTQGVLPCGESGVPTAFLSTMAHGSDL